MLRIKTRKKTPRVMVTEPDEFIPTRKTLLIRLKDWSDRESWKEFFDIYWKLIYSTAIKAGLTDAEAQDVVQETIISVSKSMPQFHYDPALGSFKTWLMRLTGWRIMDHLRRRQSDYARAPRRAGENARTATIERIPDPNGFDPSAIWDQEWEKNLVDVAIAQVKQQVDPKQFQLFDLNVLQEWPAKKIVATLGVSASKVYLAKHRISRLIRKEMRRLERNIPGADAKALLAVSP